MEIKSADPPSREKKQKSELKPAQPLKLTPKSKVSASCFDEDSEARLTRLGRGLTGSSSSIA